MRSIVRGYGYPTILIFCMGVLWWGITGPYPIEYVSTALQVLMIFTVVGLEYYIPYNKSWGTVRDLTRADVIYFLSAPIIDQLQIFLFVGLLAATQQFHSYIAVVDFWPREWPILVQWFLATNVVDVCKYWWHRWTHEVPALWRIHIVHHCLDRLEMLRSAYFQPIDLFVTQGTGTLVLLLLGVDFHIIIFHNVYAGITGLLNHSNADLDCGWLDTILNSIGHHRAHHMVEEPGCFSNYGSFFNFADRMFGTRYLPEDQSDISPLGLSDDYVMPKTVLKQLAVPFHWDEVYRPKQQ